MHHQSNLVAGLQHMVWFWIHRGITKLHGWIHPTIISMEDYHRSGRLRDLDSVSYGNSVFNLRFEMKGVEYSLKCVLEKEEGFNYLGINKSEGLTVCRWGCNVLLWGNPTFDLLHLPLLWHLTTFSLRSLHLLPNAFKKLLYPSTLRVPETLLLQFLSFIILLHRVVVVL